MLPDQVDVPLAAVARGLLFRVLTTSRTHPERSTALAEEAHRHESSLEALRL
jgi:hypothetical protein